MESLKTLAEELYDAKQVEANAKSQRIAIEENIAKLVETGENGSKTVQAGDKLKVTVKRALGYKADVDAIRAMENIPDEVKPLKLIPATPEGYIFDTKAYETLISDHPDVAAKLGEVVIVTPRKVSVTLKLA